MRGDKPLHSPTLGPCWNHTVDNFLRAQPISQRSLGVPVQLWQVAYETPNLGKPADRPVSRNNPSRVQPQYHFQSPYLALDAGVLKVRMIPDPENITREHNPVSRNMDDRVAVSMGPHPGMKHVHLEIVLRQKTNAIPIRQPRV